MLFLASFTQPAMETGIVENYQTFNKVRECTQKIPSSMVEHVPLYVEHFDEENLYKAMRIGWCESRGKETAYRKSANDSGLMQFIPSTWDWIAEKFDLPIWNTDILLYNGTPIQMHPKDTHYYDIDLFEFRPVQMVPYYNILMASHLAEDTYSKVTFRDWNSSKWCWENTEYFEWRWRDEGF